MEDIRLHSALRLGQPFQETANRPVVYTCLEAKHLNQVHQLLEASFWPGIDISSSLEWEPERSTVVAVYKSYLVVGVALITEPQEMYITYLAVRPGWRACGIATRMLYHLLQFNEWKDVSLHVSANNNAMLLYNLFGFKIEEFITNFYQNYLPPDDVSKESKNAFRLRLRR
ncbi:hypothetical protein DL96DRAFT_1458127 [Flagelloscypha sp. PMI_526]|nr:hypothetical protein DL96DRAFT_1458127 [Flagelloscypha sp. PMI_526]